jgi:oligoribonuclease
MVWVDLEMTGLDPQVSVIVEIATIVTESDLTVVAEGPSLVIHQPEEALAAMNDYVRELHTHSGLLERIRASTVSLADATSQTLAFLTQHCAKGTAPLCGNSVWKDRSFLERYMPSIIDLLHYRIVDVSTVKELARRWYPPELQAPRKKELHRALDDVRESIEELQWYRAKLFSQGPPRTPIA